MVRTIVSNLVTEMIESNNSKERYVLRKVWDKDKPVVTVLTLYPSSSSLVISDLTTQLITNNVFRLGYGGFNLVNLYSTIKIPRDKISKYKSKENDKYIVDSVLNSEKIIIACGSSTSTSKAIASRLFDVINLIVDSDLEDKICYLTDKNKEKNFHPLSSKVRHKWELM